MSNMRFRASDAHNNVLPMRSDRFFAAQGAWYFSTREGSSIGPFNDKEEAQKGLDDFLEFMNLAEPQTLSRLHSVLSN